MEAITAQCAKHHFDRAVALCGQCALTFCPSCLVYAFGPDKPPFCIPCALTVGGVRRSAASAPKVSWREKRARKKMLAAQNAAAGVPVEGAPAEASGTAVEEEQIDWSAPFGTAFAD
ncbi:MAG: hypothetical protein ACRDJP_04720 [Actinomycetota bacterium]